jgi:alanyl aminopeptidase
MFENYVGPEDLQKGIRQYMRKHAWGAATARDFFAAITEASGKNVTSAFSTFLDRTGVPLLSVSIDCATGAKPTLALTQQRFLPIGSKGDANEYWQVPVCFEYDAGGGKIARQCHVLADPKDRITLESATSCPAWLNANEGGTGYYRVRYDSAAGDKLFAHIDKLELREQVDLLKNVQALLGAGQMSAQAAMNLVSRFKDSPDRESFTAALNIASSVRRTVPANLRPNYARFMLSTFGERARRMGVLPKAGENDDAQLLRPDLIEVAARYGDQDIRREVKQVAGNWLKDPKSVPPEVAGLALKIAALNGDRSYFDELVAALRKTADRRDRTRIVDAIGAFRDPEIAKSAMQLMLDPSLDIRDTAGLLYAFNDEPETEHVAWPFLTANYEPLLARLPSRLGNHPGSQLPRAAAAFCSPEGYDQVQSFFKDRVKTMPGAERTLAMVLEGIQQCGPKRAAQQAGVTEFLKGW